MCWSGEVLLRLAKMAAHRPLTVDSHLRNGLKAIAGPITEPAVAEALGLDYIDPILALD